MGRQHTTWINEANWKKLENIPGNSTSSKIGYAIEHVDPDHQMWVNAKLRQLETAKTALGISQSKSSVQISKMKTTWLADCIN